MTSERQAATALGSHDAHAQQTLIWVRTAGVVGFALATAAGATVSIPLPGTPVPLTLQTLFVLLAGVTLGPRLGALSMAFYLLLGTTGYHVFAAGNWGLQTVFGATGGYLIGFVAAQPAIGWLTRKQDWRSTLAALMAGHGVIFACGLLWLAAFLGTDLARTLELGLWPFAIGGVLKIAAAFGASRWITPLRKRWFDSPIASRY